MGPVAAFSHTILEVSIVLFQVQLKLFNLPLQFNDIILILHNLVISVELNFLRFHIHLFFQQLAMLQSVSLRLIVIV